MPQFETYEHPMNERMRTLLRVEHLFLKVDYFISQMSEWGSRAALESLIDIVDFLTRTDIKNDLIKQLEKSAGRLSKLKDSAGVDHKRLHIILEDIESVVIILKDSSYQPGQVLRKSEFINIIRQRVSIPGGSCSFDLPSYHHWLQSGNDAKLKQFSSWLDDLQSIKKGIILSLNMARSSSTPVVEIAEKGFFQKSIGTESNYQLIRIILPKHTSYYPEISGGRQRFTVRFMELNTENDRPVQFEEDLDFELHCCTL